MKHSYFYSVIHNEYDLTWTPTTRSDYIAHHAVIKQIPMTTNQIIDYLEDENEILHKTINNLKIYCGNEYMTACEELELFLKGQDRVKV